MKSSEPTPRNRGYIRVSMKPRAVHTEDPDALLAHVRLPARHRISCRTTNLIERSFEEERRPPR
jgi:hypothetical protein